MIQHILGSLRLLFHKYTDCVCNESLPQLLKLRHSAGRMNSLVYYLLLIYFVSHVPITLCVDLQAIFGEHYPASLKGLLTWYVRSFGDHILEERPTWFKSFIVAEFVFQLPIFFVFIYALIRERNWIRIPAIIYGSHTTTTLLPILAEIWFSSRLTDSQKFGLVSVYSPYFIVPSIIVIYFSLNEEPFRKIKHPKVEGKLL